VVLAGQVIGLADGEIRRQLGLLAYLQTAHGGRFTMAGWMHGPAQDPQWPVPGQPSSRHFTATDDQGAGYTLGYRAVGGGPDRAAGSLGTDP
jgi:hypothetical protein